MRYKYISVFSRYSYEKKIKFTLKFAKDNNNVLSIGCGDSTIASIPKDALAMFEESGLKYLAMEDFLVMKKV